jgi:hydroxypyruvate isomerase
LNVEKVNILAGKPQNCQPGQAFKTLVQNLQTTGDRFANIGIKVMLEAINPFDAPGFFISNLQSTLEAIEGAGHPNVQFQFDFYHMARTEPSLENAISNAGRHIGHVQFADTPGRHEPGSGNIDFPAAFTALKQVGYEGAVSAEYFPQNNTISSLGWMAEFRKF